MKNKLYLLLTLTITMSSILAMEPEYVDQDSPEWHRYMQDKTAGVAPEATIDTPVDVPMDQNETKSETVTVLTSDGKNIEIDNQLVHLSSTLQNVITAYGTDEPLPVDLTSDHVTTFLDVARNLLSLENDVQYEAALQQYDLETLIRSIIVISYLNIKLLHKPFHKALANIINQTVDQFASDRNFSHLETFLTQLQRLPYNRDLNHCVLADVLHKILFYNFFTNNQKYENTQKEQQNNTALSGIFALSNQFNSDDRSLFFHADEKVEPVSIQLKGERAEYSPDGKNILTVDNNNVYLWNTSTGELVHTFDNSAFGSDTSAIFSPDGTTILISTFMHSIKLWSTLTKELILTVDYAREALFSPDGSMLLTLQQNGPLQQNPQLWNASTGNLLHTFPYDNAIGEFSPDGSKLLITARNSNDVHLWNITTKEDVYTFHHNEPVSYATLSSHGSTILTITENTIYIWDAFTGKQLHSKQYDSIMQAKLSPDGSRVLIRSFFQDDICLWNPADNSSHTLQHDGMPYSATFSPDGSTILTCADRTAYLWNLSAESPLHQLSTDGLYLQGNFNHDGSTVLLYSPTIVYVWNVATGNHNTMTLNNQITSTGSSPHDSTIFISCPGNTVLFKIFDQELKYELEQCTLEQIIFIKLCGKAQGNFSNLPPYIIDLYNQCNQKNQIQKFLKNFISSRPFVLRIMDRIVNYFYHK